MTSILETFEELCRDGASFEQALAETGLADAPLSITAAIFKFWRILEMEHAFASAQRFYDEYLLLRECLGPCENFRRPRIAPLRPASQRATSRRAGFAAQRDTTQRNAELKEKHHATRQGLS